MSRNYTERCCSCGRGMSVQYYGERCVRCQSLPQYVKEVQDLERVGLIELREKCSK